MYKLNILRYVGGEMAVFRFGSTKSVRIAYGFKFFG